MHALEIGEEPKVATVGKMFRLICYRNKANLLAAIICAGYDKHEGGQVRVERQYLLAFEQVLSLCLACRSTV